MARDTKYGLVLDERGKLLHDEPVFVIRGRDVAAPKAIRAYAEVAAKAGASPAFVMSVLQRADEVEQWQGVTSAVVKVPD